MTKNISSFWGHVTSKEWCEPNYVYSSYIAEFFNTVSNTPCIILALIGLVNALHHRFEKRFSVLHISNMILSIGSMFYHASLQRMFALRLSSRCTMHYSAFFAFLGRTNITFTQKTR
ncbi:unnamed protein product [Cuscuta europaea]|uniref:Alkaline ceramidase n=1 Tax=Cuscuta europaea TaxID=41803 RepID=A0A9P1EIL7_CUSEU|nr:unnamed protein product [Cuscuta europaea]